MQPRLKASSRPEMCSCSSASEEDLADEKMFQNLSSCCHCQHGITCFGVIACAVLFIMCGEAALSLTKSANYNDSKKHLLATAADKTVIDLLTSTELSTAIGDAAARLGELAIMQHQSRNSSVQFSTNVFQIEVKKLKGETKRNFKKVLQKFFETHTEAKNLLATVPASEQHASQTIAIFKALTDPRIFFYWSRSKPQLCWRWFPPES